jgi:hypothetical protein
MLVLVEVIALRLDNSDCELKWRKEEGTLHTYEHPDEAALRLVFESIDPKLHDMKSYSGMCHSTSWRFDKNTIVLTYVVVPDPHSSAAVSPVCRTVAASNDSLRPTPPKLEIDHIVTHAVVHIAELARRDPTVKKQVLLYPDLWYAVEKTSEQIQTIES